MKDIKVIVAAHLQYRMPSDGIYVPVLAGAEGKADTPEGYLRDDGGDNISSKNKSYCELTCLYWAWKNTLSDYLGLVHYRRHFRGRGRGDKFSKILTGEEAAALLAQADVLVPKKRHYYIETNYSQYVHAHHAEGLLAAEAAIKKLCPEYMPSYNKVMAERSGHKFNMFIMSRPLAESYCGWLFSVLGEAEKNIDISGWSAREQRVFGYLAERLLDVWLDHNGVAFKEVPYMFMERQNWPAKIAKFIKRKFCPRKHR